MIKREVIEDGIVCVIEDYGEGKIIKYIKPVETPPMPIKKVISKLAFRKRLTFNERLRIDNYEDDSSLNSSQKAVLKTYAKDFEASSEVDLDDVELRESLEALEQYGLLEKGRAEQILSYPMVWEEFSYRDSKNNM